MVVLNKPYAGGYITENYGRPHEGIHALQVEINRALYMDEVSFEKSSAFDRLRADLERMVKAIAIGTSRLGRAKGGRRIAIRPRHWDRIKKGPFERIRTAQV